jgi:hypothetical protein
MTFSPTPAQDSPKPSKEPSNEPIILVRSIDVVVEQFNEFWEKYPRKTAKVPARRAFSRALLKISFEELMEKLDYFIDVHKHTKKQFLPHASTWLNQERWHDVYEPQENFDLQKTVLSEMLNAK